MDWYRELITKEYLQLEENIMVDKFKLARLANGADLVSPTPVNSFPNAVLFRDRSPDNDHVMIYDVTTRRGSDGKFTMTAKIFETINPFSFVGTEEDFGQNFLIIKQSATMVHAMKGRRADSMKKTV